VFVLTPHDVNALADGTGGSALEEYQRIVKEEDRRLKLVVERWRKLSDGQVSRPTIRIHDHPALGREHRAKTDVGAARHGAVGRGRRTPPPAPATPPFGSSASPTNDEAHAFSNGRRSVAFPALVPTSEPAVEAVTREQPRPHRPAPHALSGTRATQPVRGEHGLPFKILVIAFITISTLLVYVTQDLLWDQGRHARGWQQIIESLALVWTLPIVTGGLSCLGMLMHRNPAPVEITGSLSTLVSFRYVSRGQNVDTLRAAVASVARNMAMLPAFPYVIEVIVEEERIDFGDDYDVIQYNVPDDYVTKNGTLYKARALQYALEHSQLPDDAWIMHCDEESHIHESLIRGMYRAISEEEESGQLRIGQGCILYHHSLEDHPFLTMADSIRTGDDVGRFHLQNGFIGYPIWGFHGSFILVRNDVEKAVGFDFGPKGSVTEDAFWGLCQIERGHRSRWVDGYMIEQAPERVRDFIKQRRRWFIGLVKVVRHAPVPFRFRAPLALFTCLWSVSWLSLIYTYINLGTGYYTGSAVQALGNGGLAFFITIYLVGLRANLRLKRVARSRALLFFAVQLACVPLFAALEGIGVLYALVRPDHGFHVIQKRH
jgi:egghead protein (zeste-white 4 protein)